MSRILEGSLPGEHGEAIAWSLHLPGGEGGPWPTVLLCHGFKGFKDWGFFPWLADRLAAAGFAALRFNYAHNGLPPGAHASERPDGLFPTFERLDLFERDRLSWRLDDARCVDEAVRDGRLAPEAALDRKAPLFFGHSMGGAVAILSAVERRARAVVTWASISRTAFPEEQARVLERDGRLLVPNGRTGQQMPVGLAAHLDVQEQSDRFDLRARVAEAPPLLCVHGVADPTVPFTASEELARGGQGRLHLVDGGDHVFGARYPFEGETPHLIEAAEVTTQFLRAAIGREAS